MAEGLKQALNMAWLVFACIFALAMTVATFGFHVMGLLGDSEGDLWRAHTWSDECMCACDWTGEHGRTMVLPCPASNIETVQNCITDIDAERAEIVWTDTTAAGRTVDGTNVMVLDEGLFGQGGRPTTGYWDFKEACDSQGFYQFVHAVAFVGGIGAVICRVCYIMLITGKGPFDKEDESIAKMILIADTLVNFLVFQLLLGQIFVRNSGQPHSIWPRGPGGVAFVMGIPTWIGLVQVFILKNWAGDATEDATEDDNEKKAETASDEDSEE